MELRETATRKKIMAIKQKFAASLSPEASPTTTAAVTGPVMNTTVEQVGDTSRSTRNLPLKTDSSEITKQSKPIPHSDQTLTGEELHTATELAPANHKKEAAAIVYPKDWKKTNQKPTVLSKCDHLSTSSNVTVYQKELGSNQRQMAPSRTDYIKTTTQHRDPLNHLSDEGKPSLTTLNPTSPSNPQVSKSAQPEVKEKNFMSAAQQQRERVARIRLAMKAATVIQRAWRKYKHKTVACS